MENKCQNYIVNHIIILIILNIRKVNNLEHFLYNKLNLFLELEVLDINYLIIYLL